METPARFREAGEKSLKHARCWDCGYLLARSLPNADDITSRITSKRRSLHDQSASPLFAREDWNGTAAAFKK